MRVEGVRNRMWIAIGPKLDERGMELDCANERLGLGAGLGVVVLGVEGMESDDKNLGVVVGIPVEVVDVPIPIHSETGMSFA